MLKFSQRLRFNLPDSFAGDPHHLADLFQGKGAVIAGYPGAIAEHLVLKPPLTGRVGAWLRDENYFFLALVHR